MDALDFQNFTPNPFHLLEIAAQENPSGIAIRSNKLELTFFEYHENAKNIAYWLRSKGVRPGDQIAVTVPLEIFPVVVMAIFHEAGVICVPPNQKTDLTKIGCRINLTVPGAPILPGLRRMEIDSAVLFGTGSSLVSTVPIDYENPDSFCKVSFTSGTTGENKAVALSLNNLLVRVQNQVKTMEVESNHCLLLGRDAYVNELIACLVRKTTINLIESALDLLEFGKRHPIGSIQTSPAYLAELLLHAESHSRVLKPKSIFITGAPLPPALHNKVSQVLGSKVISRFGSIETGVIASKQIEDHNESELGELSPGVEAEVLDNNFEILKRGQPGYLAIRSAGTVSGYIHDSALSELHFRDGWFLTADRALYDLNGNLKILGRSADFVNLGGVKVDLQQLDHFCLKLEGISEAVSFVYQSEFGLEALGLAIVTKADPDVSSMIQILRAEFGAASPITIIRMDMIPRNELGKPLRRKLAELLANS